MTTTRKPINFQKPEQSEITTINGSKVLESTTFDQRYRINNDRVISSLPPDGKTEHFSRINTFQNANNTISNHQRGGGSPFLHQKSPDRHYFYQQNVGEHVNRSYSPFQAYQNHIQMTKERRDYSPLPHRHVVKENFYSSPIAQRKVCESPSNMSPLLQRRNDDGRWSATGSPLPIRHLTQDEHQNYNYENTSPILLQRFIHQQKQAKEAEEAAKNESGN